jgi:hypothetical protein
MTVAELVFLTVTRTLEAFDHELSEADDDVTNLDIVVGSPW